MTGAFELHERRLKWTKKIAGSDESRAEYRLDVGQSTATSGDAGAVSGLAQTRACGAGTDAGTRLFPRVRSEPCGRGSRGYSFAQPSLSPELEA